MANRPSLDDYIDVAERIMNFKQEFPDGTLQTIDWEYARVGEQDFVVYRAAAYRDQDDPRPGMGIAWEPVPGLTPYTKNSELMNAETAAWGRAIVALGFAAKGSLASRQEVQARQMEQAIPAGVPIDNQGVAAAEAAVEQHKDDARPAAPTIPRDRAMSILQRAIGVEMAKIDMDAPAGTPPEYHPVFKAVLGRNGAGKIGMLNADTAEAVEAWLANEEVSAQAVGS